MQKYNNNLVGIRFHPNIGTRVRVLRAAVYVHSGQQREQLAIEDPCRFGGRDELKRRIKDF